MSPSFSKNITNVIENSFNIYFSLPNSFKKIFSFFLEPIGSRFMQLNQYLELDSYFIQGKEKHSNSNINVMYYGGSSPLIFIKKILFNEEPIIKKQDKIHILLSKKHLKKTQESIDLSILVTDRFFSNLLQKAGFIIVPEWINMEIDTSLSIEDMYKSFSRGAKSDVKRAKKSGFTYEITKDPEKLDFFYNRMFVPYISMRHGDLVPPSYFSYIKSILYRTHLLLVKEDDKYVCGGLIELKGRKANLPSMGIIDGNIEYLQKNAVVALIYYHIISAHKMGVKHVNFGDTRAFLNDGGYQYKRKWGMQAHISNTLFGIFGIKIHRFNETVESFLSNNPFTYIEKNRLNGFIYVKYGKELSRGTIDQYIKSYDIIGLSRLLIASPEGFSENIELYVPVGYETKIYQNKFMDNNVKIYSLNRK